MVEYIFQIMLSLFEIHFSFDNMWVLYWEAKSVRIEIEIRLPLWGSSMEYKVAKELKI